MESVDKKSLKFLKDIKKNNNREWFHKNKDQFKEANDNMKLFLESLKTEMNKFDVIEKTKLFRIYRDVRFSKDKTPYNSHFSMSMNREGVDRRGGYYLRITPGDSVVVCGFFGPEPKDMKLIRDHIAQDDKPLRKILKSKKIKDTFNGLEGDAVKTAPKGFSKDHPAIDLLRYKQLFLKRHFTDKEVLDKNFMKEIIKTYKNVQPFFNYMTEILTHDLNGVPLYKL